MTKTVLVAQIRAARALIGLPQEELAELAGVGPRTMSRIELGETVRPASFEAVVNALESRGIEFIEENGGGAGVRLRRSAKRVAAPKQKQSAP